MSRLRTYPQLISKHNAAYAPMQGTASVIEGKRNCAAAGGAGLANGYLGLTSADPGFVTHHQFRLLAGDPRDSQGNPRGLGTLEILRAFQALGVKATRHYAESTDLVKAALKAGQTAGVCVDYSVINGWHQGEFSGQLTFTGSHFIAIKGWRPGAFLSGAGVRDHDTLFDGRTRSWGTAPSGPQTAPWAMFEAAMAAFSNVGAGLGVFFILEVPE